MADKPLGWQDLPIGGLIVDRGNAVEYNTGNWRTFRPVVDFDKCTHCLVCWLYCPDVSIVVDDGKLLGMDLEHCKGCGVCVEVCPPKCIQLVAEGEIAQEVAR